MGTITAVIDNLYIKQIDNTINKTKLYSSRSEFFKDSIRKNLEDMIKLNKELEKIENESIKISKNAKERGWKGNMLSAKEKEKIAKEFIKENKIELK